MQSMKSTEIFLNGEEDYKFRKELQNKHTNKKIMEHTRKIWQFSKMWPKLRKKFINFYI